MWGDRAPELRLPTQSQNRFPFSQIDEERPRNKFRHFWSFFDHLLPSEADGGLFAEVPKLSLFALLPARSTELRK